MLGTEFSFQGVLLGALLMGSMQATGWTQPGANTMERWPQGTMGVDYNVVDAQGNRQGKWVRVWPDGTLYYEGQFSNGAPTGTFKFYYETGEIMTQIEHASDPRYMTAVHYRQNGKKRGEGEYFTTEVLDEAGEPIRVKHGTWKYYDVQEVLRVEEVWVNGVLDGPYAAFDGNGRSLEKGAYADGEKSGVWVMYNERGKLVNRIGYAGGQFHGDYEINDDLGRNLIVGRYSFGQPIGAWVFYNADRTVHVVRKFEDGEAVMERFENGLQAEFYEDERPKLEMHWENGKLHGTFTEWHDNGEWVVLEQQDPVTGESDGRAEIQGQTIAREGAYFAGELHGAVMLYAPDGRLISRTVYDHGNPVE